MASTNLANVPYFFKGSYNNLLISLAPGGLFQNLKKAGIAFVTDKNCLAYVDTDKSVTLIGDVSENVQPEKGTVANPIVLDTLPAGVYSISGTYQQSSGDTPINISSTQLFIIGDNGDVTKFDGSSMTKMITVSPGVTVEESYVTDGDISRAVADINDIKDLFK